jgi:hypothetical protein
MENLVDLFPWDIVKLVSRLPHYHFSHQHDNHFPNHCFRNVHPLIQAYLPSSVINRPSLVESVLLSLWIPRHVTADLGCAMCPVHLLTFLIVDRVIIQSTMGRR